MPMSKASAKSSWRLALPKSDKPDTERLMAESVDDFVDGEAESARNPSAQTARWRNRFAVAEALCLLIFAKFLVRVVRLGIWRSTLGDLIDGGLPASQVDAPAHNIAPTKTFAEASRLARSVFRASGRIPGYTKCLPRAVALQWMLKRRAIASHLIIAALKPTATAEETASDGKPDPFHAWVERDGNMLIGRCDRAMYAPIMSFSQGEFALSRISEDPA